MLFLTAFPNPHHRFSLQTALADMLHYLKVLGVSVDDPEKDGEWTPLKVAAARVRCYIVFVFVFMFVFVFVFVCVCLCLYVCVFMCVLTLVL